MADPNYLIEELFTALHGTDEWEDHDCDEKLSEWRKSLGDDALGSWEWWAREAGSNEEYTVAAPYDDQTRAGIIRAARTELGADIDLEIVEARDWVDLVTGEDFRPFAATRNAELIRGAAND